jgi:uncharacterized protein YdaU (DUF1376 family)
MSDLPFFPLWVSKYEARTAHLTLEEDGAYLRLLRLCWVTPQCRIPADDAWIARMMRVDMATFERVVRPMLSEFFRKEGKGASAAFINPKLLEIYLEKSGISQMRRAAGRAGGNAKALKTRQENAGNKGGGRPAKANNQSQSQNQSQNPDAAGSAPLGEPRPQDARDAQ